MVSDRITVDMYATRIAAVEQQHMHDRTNLGSARGLNDEPCALCTKPVFQRDRVRVPVDGLDVDLLIHRACFKCDACSRPLSLGRYFCSSTEGGRAMHCFDHKPAADPLAAPETAAAQAPPPARQPAVRVREVVISIAREHGAEPVAPPPPRQLQHPLEPIESPGPTTSPPKPCPPMQLPAERAAPPSRRGGKEGAKPGSGADKGTVVVVEATLPTQTRAGIKRLPSAPATTDARSASIRARVESLKQLMGSPAAASTPGASAAPSAVGAPGAHATSALGWGAATASNVGPPGSKPVAPAEHGPAGSARKRPYEIELSIFSATVTRRRAERARGGGAATLAQTQPPAPAPPAQFSARAARAGATVSPSTVNINTGSVSDLMRLPGVGRQLAAKIVDDRKRKGPFQSAADLSRISGVGSLLVKKLAPLVVV